MKPSIDLLVLITKKDVLTPASTTVPMVDHLVKHPAVRSVAVADLDDNPGLAREPGFIFPSFNVRYLHEGVSMRDFEDLPTEIVDPSKFNMGLSRMTISDTQKFDNIIANVREQIPVPFFNKLESMKEFGSKAKLAELQDQLVSDDGYHYIPRTRTVKSMKEIREFQREIDGDVVVKSFYGEAGKEVHRIKNTTLGKISAAFNLRSFIAKSGGEVCVQEFIHMEKVYDDRVIVMYNPKSKKMEAKAVIRRVAQNGGWKSNLSQGGQKEFVELDARHHRLAKALNDFLLDKELILVGVDVMYDKNDLDSEGRPRPKIAEINVRNVGSLTAASEAATEQTGRPIDFREMAANGYADIMLHTLKAQQPTAFQRIKKAFQLG